MQEPEDPWGKPVSAGRAVRRTGVVRLVSTNPLALPELERLALPARMRCHTFHLKLGLVCDVGEIRVPRSSIVVLDTFSTGAMTEKVIAALRMQQPRACVIALVNDLADAEGFTLLQLGVKGIVNHRELAGKLGAAIAFVASGGVRMPRGLMAKYLDSNFNASPLLPTPKLSQRERQVLEGVVKSRSNKEISDELHISESTVKFHLARIFRKFRVRRRAELIVQSAQDQTSVH